MTIRLHLCWDADATLLPERLNRRLQNMCRDDDDIICAMLVTPLGVHCQADASSAGGGLPQPVRIGEKQVSLG